ncbi:MAG: glycosyltransferase [Anaerolineales bacterium]|nr:glycosyltransferase [Anaerolineales bacterium]
MSQLHVHVIYEHNEDLKPFGVAYIRDILPLSHPVNASALQVSYSTDYASADVIIVERAWKPGLDIRQAESLVRQVRASGARMVYTIDDNLLDLENIPLAARLAVRYFCRYADGILVSTDYLKARLERLNPHISVLPNALDERLFTDDGQRLSPGRNASRRAMIGFMGTFTHDMDLMMILQPLRAVMRRHLDTVQLQIVGGVANPAVLRAFQGLPVQVLRPEVNNIAYPNFVPWMRQNLLWDIGIAPLEDTAFTRSKSDIKFLDYSALAIPGIYSRVSSYENTLHHLENGCLVENTPAAWDEALEMLLSDANLRARLAHSAQEYTFSHRTLEHCAHLWRDALLSIVESK